jgi:phosphohistidine phosphatase
VTRPVGKTLWLLRHAKAVADPPAGGNDFDRVLAPRGRRDAAALGRLIVGRGDGLEKADGLEKETVEVEVDIPQIAFVSPAARTMATADLVLEHVPALRRESPADLYGADANEVMAHLRSVRDDVAAVMVVGHNPTAHVLAVNLISPDDEDGERTIEHRGFPTCALAVYRLDIARWADAGGPCGHLIRLLTPPFDGA